MRIIGGAAYDPDKDADHYMSVGSWRCGFDAVLHLREITATLRHRGRARTAAPVTEDDLPVLGALTNDPDTAGPYAWFGRRDPAALRRRWEDSRLLTDDGGTFMVVRGDERLGYVAWRKVQTTPNSYCWNIGIGLLPHARGRGYSTVAQRLLARYLFAHSLANRVEADTEVDNLPEQRALEKAGFTREGCCAGSGSGTANGGTA